MPHRPIIRALALLPAIWVLTPIALAQVKFEPREIDDLLANPDIGWQTFGRAAAKDPNLPEWLPSTVCYHRFGWKDLEPTPGDYRFAALDRRIAAAADSGQHFAFRVMCVSSNPENPYHPAWLEEIGGRIVSTAYEGRRVRAPDLDDPKILEPHLRLIAELGRRYDGDARLAHVDIGSVGWWGEWHMSASSDLPMPSAATRRRIVDAYLDAFKRTPLVMLVGGGDDLAYACSRGAGWRADCLGDMGGEGRNWCHMRKGYPLWFRLAALDEAWKRGPVAYESCWDMRRWKQENWPLRYIFNYALATHASVLNNKSAPLPVGDDVRPEIERFVRRLGYRIVLRNVAVESVEGGVRIGSTWQNVGSAPIYRPARVRWQLRPVDKSRTAIGIDSALDPRTLMPGEVELFTPQFMADPPDLPNGPPITVTDGGRDGPAIPPGEYELRVGVFYGEAGDTMVRLAIEGRDADGWYTLGRLRL